MGRRESSGAEPEGETMVGEAEDFYVDEDARPETPFQRADRNWGEILQEARVTQTCTQIIGGFLLAVAFQPRFGELDTYQMTVYLILVSLAGLATALGLALVVMHREFFGKQQKLKVVRLGNWLLVCNLVVVSLLALLVTSLIFDFVLSRLAGFIVLGTGVVVTFVLWVVVPRIGGARKPD